MRITHFYGTLLLFLFLLFGCKEKKHPQEAMPIPVKEAVAICRSVPLYLETVGHIEAYTVVDIMAQADGFLVKTHFANGADVKKGELLYSIDPRPYLAEKKRADGSLEEIIADLQFAKRNAMRNTPLVEDDYISQNSYDQLTTRVLSDEALVKQREGAADLAAINLSYTTIYSPIDARAGFSLIDDGNLILKEAKTTLVTLNQITPIYATFFLPGKNLPAVQRNQKEQTHLDVLVSVEDPSINPYHGKLTFIDNGIDLSTGMVQLKATIPNEEKELWPNQYVKVKLILEILENSILIPQKAIQRSAKENIVFVIKEDHSVTKRKVTIGQVQDNDWIVINKGIKKKEHVVTDGQINLYEGAKVKIVHREEGRKNEFF